MQKPRTTYREAIVSCWASESWRTWEVKTRACHASRNAKTSDHVSRSESALNGHLNCGGLGKSKTRVVTLVTLVTLPNPGRGGENLDLWAICSLVAKSWSGQSSSLRATAPVQQLATYGSMRVPYGSAYGLDPQNPSRLCGCLRAYGSNPTVCVPPSSLLQSSVSPGLVL